MGPLLRLHFGEGSATPGESAQWRRRILVGRHQANDVALTCPSVSRRHAALWPGAAAWRLIDYDSRNGTFVNGGRVETEGVPVRAGDLLQFGGVVLRVGEADPMTRDDWRHCHDPVTLLEALHESGPSARKLRLFACAWYRDALELTLRTRNPKAAAVVERYADGLETPLLTVVRRELLHNSGADGEWLDRLADVVLHQAGEAGWEEVRQQLDALHERDQLRPQRASFGAVDKILTGTCPAILRDMLHPPGCAPSPGDWIAWENGTVARMAEAIYAEKRFADMPVLGDALEDAGCADAEVLTHCRSREPHWRGCWVIDMLTGRR